MFLRILAVIAVIVLVGCGKEEAQKPAPPVVAPQQQSPVTTPIAVSPRTGKPEKNDEQKPPMPKPIDEEKPKPVKP